MFPNVADIIRCPTEILSICGGGVGAGLEPVPVVAVMVATVSVSSKCDVHDAPEESISAPNALPEAPGWLEAAERSSPIVIQSAVTDGEIS